MLKPTKNISDKFLTLTLLLGGFLQANPALATQWQDLDQLSATAVAHVEQRLAVNRSSQRIVAHAPDARLRLNQCDAPLQASTLSGVKSNARIAVKVSCPSPKAWKVYVQVSVATLQHVVVARRNLPRGHEITADDVELAQVDISNRMTSYLTATRAAQGQILTRSLLAGALITPAQLRLQATIRRGQQVTIGVHNDGMQIRMSGIALSDGAVGQRIRVRNVSSGRIIEGAVRDANFVEVGGG